MTDPLRSDHLLVRAARGESVPRPPVWAMRQAGRWDPEFRKIRAQLGFYEFSEDIDKSVEASLCPQRFGTDAIILFYDITTLPVAMGLPFELKKEFGPQPDRSIQSLADLERLNPHPDPSRYGHIRELLRRVRERLAGRLPVIVFAGAPFTVATYCIGTGKNIQATRAFISRQPDVWTGLLERLQIATKQFLQTLVREGADVYQLFDSWAGLLDEAEYQQYAQKYHTDTFREVRGVPGILFVKECPYLDAMVQTGASVVSLGRQHDLAYALEAYPKMVFQGNVDEAILRLGTPEQVRDAVKAVLKVSQGERHILNLNHGVGKETPPENVAAFMDAAKESL